VPKELQETAFNRALDLLAAPAGQPPITPPPARTSTPGAGVASPPPLSANADGGSDEDSFYAKLIKETEVPRGRLESIVHLDEGVPKMAINPKKVPSGKKGGQLFIARVILTARHVWLEESELALAEVRAECDRYGVADANFAAHMKSMDAPGLTLT